MPRRYFLVLLCVVAVGAPAHAQRTGIVWFSQARYAPGTAHIAVSISDPDRDSNPGSADVVDATLTSARGDSEPLRLTETGLSTGIFTAPMDLDISKGPVAGDGMLQVYYGDYISCLYDDPQDDFGNPHRVAEAVILAGIEGNLRGTLPVSTSPYVITGDVFVNDALTVEPGVEILLAPGVAFRVHTGAVHIDGTAGHEVRFTALVQGAAPLHWGAFVVMDAVTDPPFIVELHHVVFDLGGAGREDASLVNSQTLKVFDSAIRRSATTGVEGFGLSTELWNVAVTDNAFDGVSGQALDLINCQVERNGYYGVNLSAYPQHSSISGRVRFNGMSGLLLNMSTFATVSVQNCIVTNNGRFGIQCGGTGSLQVNGCELFDNASDYDFWCTSSTEVNARSNYWGPATTAEMAAGGNPKNITRIHDVYDEPVVGFVNYSAWLSTSGVKPVSMSALKRAYR